MAGADRLSKNDVRQRRMAQRLNEGLFIFGNGIEFDQDSQTISIDILTNGGLEFAGAGSDELAVNAGLGIFLDASGVNVDIATDAGLEFLSNELAVNAGLGIFLDASGVNVDLLASGGLEFTGNELNIADTIVLGVVGASGIVTFSSSTVNHGIIVGVTKIGNDPTTATSAMLSHTSHTATPAVRQTTSGDTRIGSASGQVIRINPTGTAGVWIGAGNKDLTPAGLGSTIIGGTDATGNITATGQNNVAVGVALTAATIQSTGTFFSFACGAGFSSGTITSSNFASVAWGLVNGSSAVLTSSGFASVAGGVCGFGFPNVMTVSGNASFAWGGGHVVTAATCAAFGESNTVSAISGFACGESNAVNSSMGFACGEGNTVSATKAAAFGTESNARLASCRSLAGDSFSADGDGQQIDICAYARTTSATPANMTIDGASARLTIQANSTVSFSILVVAKEETAGGERAAYRIEGAVYRDATAASTTVAGVATTVLHESTGTMNATATADTTNGALNIVVTGVALRTIRWTAAVRMAEVIGS